MTFDPNNPTASGMVLTFDDEFNGVSWSSNSVANNTLWTDQGINNPSSLGTATANPSGLSVGNGVLTITAQNSGGGFTSGMLQSVNSADQGFAQKYGYFEADIKIPAGQAAWPAFFLYSQPHFTNGAPPSEIDIMEAGGSNDAMWAGTIHDGTGNQNGNNVQNAGLDLSQGYHRYGMLWDPNSSDVTWYLDGKEVMTAPKFSDTDAQAEFMALQLQLNNNNTGTLQMQADYVRVYQFANQNPTAVQAQAVSPASGNNDPVAHVNALGQSGTAGGVSPTPAPTPAPAPAPTPSSHAGTPSTSGGDPTVTVRVSGDHWAGAPNGQPDPQFIVLVDGQQVGGVQTVQAVHDSGQWQDITVNGNFTNPQQVDIRFLNDQYGGSHAQDINLYVDSVALLGHQFFGSSAQNSGAQGYTDASDPNAAVMTIDGDLVFNVAGSGTASNPTAAAPSPSPAPAPAPAPTPAVSADGTTVIGSHGEIVSDAHHVFAINAAGQITENGGVLSQTGNVTELVYLNHTLYQEATSQKLWWSFNEASNTWASAADPLTNPTGSGASGGSTSPTATVAVMNPTFSDAAGHDIFVFKSVPTAPTEITAFQPNADLLDIAPLLKNYTGTDPIQDHIITLVASGTDSTKVMFDPTGHDPNHGTTLITLDHVLPQGVHAANFLH